MSSAPAPAPSPADAATSDAATKKERWTRRLRKIQLIVAVAAVLVVGLVWLGRKEMMGTKYAVNDKESIHYSGSTTEADARRLGEALNAAGYFTGDRAVDVLFRKDEKEGTVVSFVLTGRWSDAEIVAAFRQIGASIGAQDVGKPLTIRLLDDKLNSKNEFRVD